MNGAVNRTGRAPSLPAMLPLLSKFSRIAARVLPGLSKAALYFTAFLVLVNMNSFPFTWHCESPPPSSPSTRWSLNRLPNSDKIFRHVWIIRIKFLLYRLTLIGKSRETKKKLESAWLERLIPMGSGTNLCQSKEGDSCIHFRALGLWHGHQEVCWAR